MKILPPRKKWTLLSFGALAATVTVAALAQTASPAKPASPSTQVVVAPAAAGATPSPVVVVAPVVPTAPAQNPGALAAIEQSVTTTPVTPSQAPGTTAPSIAAQGNSGVAPYVVPPAGTGIFSGSDQTLREIAFLETEVALAEKRKARVDAMSALKESEQDLQDVLAGRKPGATAAAASAAGAVPAGVGPPLPGAAPGAVSVVATPAAAPEPYVNSVYGYGDEMFAEIVIVGSGKVLASKGTVLMDGSKVVSVSPNGVVLSTRRGGTKRLMIRGAIGY